MNAARRDFQLLALCATAPGSPLLGDRLRTAAERLSAEDWRRLAAFADGHGMAPLLEAHLRAANITPPEPVADWLRARAAQHAHANRVRATVLAEILTALQAAGIEALVLKGAALAHIAYPSPGLRPMGDVDVLVSRKRVREAQALLARLGFDAPVPGVLPPKHLPPARRTVEGVEVVVELHYNLYERGSPATALEALQPDALPFSLPGVTAYTLGHEAMLDHLYFHMRRASFVFRILTVADMVMWSERFVAEIEWSRVSSQVRHALAMWYWLTPFSPQLVEAAAIEACAPPRGVGLEFDGWPRHSLAAQRHKGLWGILHDTFFPSEWWVRLYYGLPDGPALWWGRLVRHPLWVFGWVLHYFRHRALKS